jgi:hypothetical protein
MSPPIPEKLYCDGDVLVCREDENYSASGGSIAESRKPGPLSNEAPKETVPVQPNRESCYSSSYQSNVSTQESALLIAKQNRRTILEVLLRNPPKIKPEREARPVQTASVLGGNGVTNFSASEYERKISEGLQALQRAKNLLISTLSTGQNPTITTDFFDRLSNLLETFRKAAEEVRRVFTKDGMSEFVTRQNFKNYLFDLVRKYGSQSKQTVHVSAINPWVTGLNKLDDTYKSGDAAKELIFKIGTALESKFPGAKVLGFRGNMLIVAGLPPHEIANFEEALVTNIEQFLKKGGVFLDLDRTGRMAERIGVHNADQLRIVQEKHYDLGIKSGTVSINIPFAEITPEAEKKGTIDTLVGQVIDLTDKAEANVRLGIESPTDPIEVKNLKLVGVPNNGGGKPDLINPETDIEYRPPRPMTDKDQKNMPNPNKEGGQSLGNHRQLLAKVEEAKNYQNQGNIEKLYKVLRAIKSLLIQASSALRAKALEAMKHRRFRIAFDYHWFPYVSQAKFKEGFYSGMLEFKDFGGHNKGRPADPEDSVVGGVVKKIRNYFKSRGIEVVIGMRERGDEISFAHADRSTGGKKFTQDEVVQLHQGLVSSINQDLSKIPSHIQMAKVPPHKGGFYKGKKFVLVENTLFIDGQEGEKLSKAQEQEFRQRAELVFGKEKAQSAKIEVVKFSKRFPDIIRRPVFTAPIPDTSYEIEKFDPEVLHPDDNPQGNKKPPDGHQWKEAPLSVTASKATHLSKEDPIEVIETSRKVSESSADTMKGYNQIGPLSPQQIEALSEMAKRGESLPPEKMAQYGLEPTSEPLSPTDLEAIVKRAQTHEPVSRPGWLERIQHTRCGKVGASFGAFALGEISSELFVKRDFSILGDVDFYRRGGITLVGGKIGHWAGDLAARSIIEGRTLLSREVGQFFNPAIRTTQYTGARAVGINIAATAGAVLLTEKWLNGEINWSDLHWTAGTLGAGRASAQGFLGLVYKLRPALRTPNPTLPGLALMAASVVLEFTVIKWIGEWRAGVARKENEAELRSGIAKAMREFDQKIARGEFANPQAFERELAKVGDLFGSYFQFQFMHNTKEGKELFKIQQKFEQKKKEFDELSKSGINFTPSSDGPMMLHEIGYIGLKEDVEELEQQLKEATRKFHEALKKYTQRPLLINEEDLDIPIYLGSSNTPNEVKLRSDPMELFHQFSKYSESREAFLKDEKGRKELIENIRKYSH